MIEGYDPKNPEPAWENLLTIWKNYCRAQLKIAEKYELSVENKSELLRLIKSIDQSTNIASIENFLKNNVSKFLPPPSSWMSSIRGIFGRQKNIREITSELIVQLNKLSEEVKEYEPGKQLLKQKPIARKSSLPVWTRWDEDSENEIINSVMDVLNKAQLKDLSQNYLSLTAYIGSKYLPPTEEQEEELIVLLALESALADPDNQKTQTGIREILTHFTPLAKIEIALKDQYAARFTEWTELLKETMHKPMEPALFKEELTKIEGAINSSSFRIR